MSIINFKGGVGKTTLSFNLAAGLTWYHKAKVLLIDMDHQISLSIVCLGARKWKEVLKFAKSVKEVFKPFVGQSQNMPGKQIICERRNSWELQNYPNLMIVPADLELDDVEIELTASHHGNAIQSEWDKRTLVCKWLEETGVDADFDYIIFDCPPATKIVSQNAIAASHGYIIPIVPEAVMERGAPHLVNMVKNGIDKRLTALAAMGGTPRGMYVHDTKLTGLAITRIQTSGPAHSGYINDHTQHLSSLKRTWGNHLESPTLRREQGFTSPRGGRSRL